MELIDLVALFGGLFAIWGILIQVTKYQLDKMDEKTKREMDQRQEYYQDQLSLTRQWMGRPKKIRKRRK